MDGMSAEKRTPSNPACLLSYCFCDLARSLVMATVRQGRLQFKKSCHCQGLTGNVLVYSANQYN